MRTSNTNPAWKNEPMRLTEQEKEDPLPVLREFYSSYHLNEVRETLWDWFTIAITTDNPTFDDGSSRSSLLLFYERLEKLLEALYLLVEKKGL